MDPNLPTILLVDDREANLLTLGEVLAPLPARLVKASSGREALKYLLDEECALILLDVQMPDLDGFETAALIHARERTRTLPIIFVTAVHREEEQIIRGYTYGAVDYILKPFEPAALLAKVGFFVNQYAREQRLRDEASESKAREAQANAKAEAQRAQLHNLFTHAPGAIATVRGPQLLFDLVNPCFEEMFHCSDVRGRAASEVLQGEGAGASWRIVGEVVRAGEPFAASEFPDLFGEKGRWFNFVVQPLRESGMVAGAMIHVVEVTAAVLAKRESDAFAHRLQEADRNKDQFLAMLGHELRNPLAPILTAVQLMKLQKGGEGAQRGLTIIERQVTHLTRLVEDLLDVSRATTGKIVLRRETLEVSSVVSRAMEVAAPLVEAKRHHLTVNVPVTGLLVAGDPVRLSQVIANLLNNACKYTDEGGRIEIESRVDGDSVLISVKDDGRGIAPERLSAMFELFVQGDQPADRSDGGLGIGLTLVRSLVRLHGGEVEARSTGPGAGATFIVRLPMVRRREGVPSQPVQVERRVRSRRRVLVVDDNRDAADMLTEVLQHAGHEVREEHDGMAALAATASFCPDVMLLDLGLPGLDGLEVARRLREDPELAETRIVALTGYGQDSDRRHTAEAGIDLHLVKPVSIETLLAAVQGPD